MSTATKITERGWGAHFCGASTCLFRRNTLIELGDVRIVVSSVGNYRTQSWGDAREIGCDRYYETMAFYAQQEGPYWEANICREVSFDSPWKLNECGLDADAKMNAIHDEVVAEIAAKVACGHITNAEVA